MPTLEQRIWQLRIALWVLIWLASCVLVSIWSMLAGAAAFGLGGGLLLWLRSTSRGPFGRRPAAAEALSEDPAQREREARYMVTQLLRNLTRIQVAYLCQSFSGPREGLAWLKRTLPRGYRQAAQQLQGQLEQARQGDDVPGVRLALRVLERRDALLRTIDALEEAHKDHHDHAIANPVIFVITEHLSSEEDADPIVVTLAGWNPSQPTLLPEVDTLNIFSEEGKERHIRGHAALADVRRVVTTGELRVINRDPKVYAADRLEGDLVRKGVTLNKVPLGFVIGAAEMM